VAEDVDTLAMLLAEGLDLCVRAKSIDDQHVKSAMRDLLPDTAKAYPGVYGKSGTPYLWVQDQYDKDLSEWEARARKTLSELGFIR
jgi:hypothetical protein